MSAPVLDPAGLRSAPATTPRIPRRPFAAQEGQALSRRSAAHRGNRRRPAHRRHDHVGDAHPRGDCRAWARRSAGRRGAGACRIGPRPPAAARSSSATARGDTQPEWTIGPGARSLRGLTCVAVFRSVRCVVHGPTAGGPWSSTAVRSEFRRLGQLAGIRRRFAPHQLRHAHAVEMARKGVPLNIIQRQFRHANLGITSIYLQGIDSGEIIDTVNGRPAPVISASAGLRL